MNRLKIYYNDVIIHDFMKNNNLKNKMSVPRLLKIVINVGFGSLSSNKKIIDSILNEISLITGQKPIITKAKKSIAGFKIREGYPIGCKVTLRRDRMYYFLDKILSVVLPRVRDFRGLNYNSFDGNGNYSFGIKEQIIFPEINYDKINRLRGMDITVITSSNNNEYGKKLLKAFNFPFNYIN